MSDANEKRRWSDFSGGQKTAIVTAATLELALKLFAARDLVKRPAGDVRGSKALWAPLLLVNFLGPIAYLAFGRR